MMKTKYFLPTLMILMISFQGFAQHSDHLLHNYCSKANIYSKAYSPENLNQPELLNDYDVRFYFLDINVENNTIDVSGYVTIQAEVTAAVLDTFAFELVSEMAIDSIWVDGQIQQFDREGDIVFVLLSNGFSQGEIFSTKIKYGGTPPTGGFFAGITTDYSTSWGKDVTWTLSEPFNARQWWPCKQDLYDKADSVWVFLTTDENNKAGSNGLLTAVTPMPDNKLRYEWKSNYPIAYYLISFAVSEYQEYNIYAHPAGYSDSILIQNYIYDAPGCLNNYQQGIDNTIDFLELFSEKMGLYPFHEEKYGHCLTELGGGMEHQTMSTMGGFGFGLVAHELGHMWFGDNVTCATWSDIWVNEGFATYSDYLVHEYIAGGDWPEIWMDQAHSYVLSQPGGSVYVPPDEAVPGNEWRIFDGRLSYYKGSLLIHMLRFEIQDDALFFQALTNFQNEFADNVATGMDFKNSVEVTTGMDLDQFFDQWYFGEGYPIFEIVWNQSGGNLNFTSTQTTSTSVTTLFQMKVPYKLNFTDGSDTTIIVEQTANVNDYSIPVAKSIESLEVDPEEWILNEVSSITVGGLEDIQHPLYFSLSPVPVEDDLQITFRNKIDAPVTISVIDETGRLVKEITTRSNHVSVDVREFDQGFYLINAGTKAQNFTGKFVKN